MFGDCLPIKTDSCLGNLVEQQGCAIFARLCRVSDMGLSNGVTLEMTGYLTADVYFPDISARCQYQMSRQGLVGQQHWAAVFEIVRQYRRIACKHAFIALTYRVTDKAEVAGVILLCHKFLVVTVKRWLKSVCTFTARKLSQN